MAAPKARLVRSATKRGAARNAAKMRERGVPAAQASAKALSKKRQEKKRRGQVMAKSKKTGKSKGKKC